MTFTDQMGRPVVLADWPPKRIVSLVPSQTEYLAALGLDHEVVGITKFCVHPRSWFERKTRIGGTKTLHLSRIAGLRPDLILGNKEENQQEQIEALAKEFPVWMSDILVLDHALEMMRSVGVLTGRAEQAHTLAALVESRFAALAADRPAPLTAAYLIWRKPYMAVGGGAFIHDMLQRCGFINVFEHVSRYPEISREQLALAAPDVLLLSSEPYPFSQKHRAELQEICPNARICLVDGTMFSWYGSRLLDAPAYFRRIVINCD
jgi:ABC-type Fe3+-hydroxamate transport system substrate-binding protein